MIGELPSFQWEKRRRLPTSLLYAFAATTLQPSTPVATSWRINAKIGLWLWFTKIDLADAYNQVRLGPKSRERLALSTHGGVLLQNVLLFVICSAPGYFQQVMDEITSDLPGVAIYLDDILWHATICSIVRSLISFGDISCAARFESNLYTVNDWLVRKTWAFRSSGTAWAPVKVRNRDQ